MPAAAPGVPDFTAIPGAPTRAVSAMVVAATAQPPAYCDVQGYIAPQIHFELRLPTTTWQGRYLQERCAGFCGAGFPPAFRSCTVQPGGDFAVASTDDGHASASPGGFDGLWTRDIAAYYGYRAALSVGGGQGADRHLLRRRAAPRLLRGLLRWMPAAPPNDQINWAGNDLCTTP